MTEPVSVSVVSVPVDGGALAVGVWGPSSGDVPVVLAVHGITASHLSWAMVAAALGGEVRLLAPDLRGRGASSELPGPYGLRSHARDMVAVLDWAGVESAVVVGHSMGAYVAGVMAESFPERVQRVVMVDGGLPLPVPAGLSVDQLVEAVIGPARARLSMTFASREEYRAFWRNHPALAAAWGPEIEAYVDYDLVGEAPSFRSRVSLDAVLGDSEDTLVDESLRTALSRITVPIELARAERGMLDEPTPLFPDALVAAWLEQAPTLVDLGVVPDTNHYTVTMSTHGAAAVAGAIRNAVTQAEL